jgi:hypothetical protein
VSIDAIRDLIRFSSNAPQMKKCTIFIIDGFESIQSAAANALLKVLEEPPPSVQFLLIGHNRNRILPTLLSRMCGVACDPCTPAEMAAYLESLEGVPGPVKELLPLLFQQRVGWISSFLKRPENLVVPAPATLSELMAEYETGFGQYGDWVCQRLKEFSHFPTLSELSSLFSQAQVMFFLMPRFRLVQGLFSLKEKPKNSTLFYLAGRIESLFYDRRDSIKKQVQTGLDQLGKDPLLGRDLYEKDRMTEWKQVASSLLQQRFALESRDFIQQILIFCHHGIRLQFQLEPLSNPVPAGGGLLRSSPRELKELYLETEKTLERLGQNALLPLQLAALLSRLAG